MLSVIADWKDSQFVRNVAKVSSGKLTALAIAIAATPVISRLFDPADFGIASLFIASTTVIASVLPLAYERAVLFPKEEESAAQVFLVAMTTGLAVTAVLYLVILIAFVVQPEIAESRLTRTLILLSPAAALLVSLRATFVALSMRREDFSSIAIADVIDVSTMASSRIAWGVLFTSSVAGLLLGHFLGLAVATGLLIFRSRHWIRQYFSPGSARKLAATASQFRDYPVYRAPAKLAFTASRRLPVIALGFLFTAEVVGFFAMANRAVGRPIDAASTSLSNVLLRQTMGLRQDGRPIRQSLVTIVTVLVLTGLPIFSVVYFFGQEILAWFLGSRWSQAGRIVEIMAPYFFVLWVGSFTPAVFESLRLNKVRLKLNTGNLFVRVAVFATCGMVGAGLDTTLLSFVWVGCAYQLFVFLVAAKAVIQHDDSLAEVQGTEVGAKG